jgi:hypothetical protein
MNATTANLGQDIASAPSMAPMEAARFSRNPLRDEPDPVVVGAVKRFGLAGLVVGARMSRLNRAWLAWRASLSSRLPCQGRCAFSC